MISGRAGLALLMDDGQLASIHADEPEQTVRRQPGEFHHLASHVRDFVVVDVATRGEVVRELLLAQEREDALQLVLIAQDPELSAGVRREAIEELEELLQNGSVRAFVENVLYSHPLPDGLDLETAMQQSSNIDAREVHCFLELFWTRQDAIREVRKAWESIPLADFQGDDDHWRATMVREGVFRDLASCRASGGDTNALFAQVWTRKTAHNLPNYEAVLKRWFKQLPKPTETGFGVPSLKFSTAVTLAYFETLRIPRLEGRDFTEQNVLNKTLAEQNLIGESALAERIRADSKKTLLTAEVIGIGQNTKHRKVPETPGLVSSSPLQNTYTAREDHILRSIGRSQAA